MTDKELAICRAIGARWVSRDSGEKCAQIKLWRERPLRDDDPHYGCLFYRNDESPTATIDATLFPSIGSGDFIKVP